MNVNIWNISTKKIFQGVLLFSLAGIVYSILKPVSTANSLAGGSKLLSIFTILVGLAVIVGYVLYFLGIKQLKEQAQLEAVDQKSVNMLYTSVILSIIGWILSLIPVISIIGSIINLIAFIIAMVAYSGLKNSPTLVPTGKSGASLLFTVCVLQIIAWVLSIIPLISLIGGILYVVCFILTILGWKKFATPIAEY